MMLALEQTDSATPTARVVTAGPPASEASPSPLAAFLAAVPMFSSLSPVALEALAERCHRRRYRRGEIIFHRDDPGNALYVIVTGRVRIHIVSDLGEELTLALLRPGDCFGELALLDGGERAATAVTLEPTQALTLQRDDVFRVLLQHPEAAVALLQVLAQRLKATNDQLLATSYLDVSSRVAKKLLDLAALDGVRIADGIRIELTLTQQGLATMLGASREATGRALNEFRDRGWLRFEQQRIILIQLERFERWLLGS